MHEEGEKEREKEYIQKMRKRRMKRKRKAWNAFIFEQKKRGKEAHKIYLKNVYLSNRFIFQINHYNGSLLNVFYISK